MTPVTPRLFWTTRGFDKWNARNNPNLPGTAKFRKWQQVAEAEQQSRADRVYTFFKGAVLGSIVATVILAATIARVA